MSLTSVAWWVRQKLIVAGQTRGTEYTCTVKHWWSQKYAFRIKNLKFNQKKTSNYTVFQTKASFVQILCVWSTVHITVKELFPLVWGKECDNQRWWSNMTMRRSWPFYDQAQVETRWRCIWWGILPFFRAEFNITIVAEHLLRSRSRYVWVSRLNWHNERPGLKPANIFVHALEYIAQLLSASGSLG